MININECMKRYGRSPLFTKMIENELKSHGAEICVCSYEFTQFFVTRGLEVTSIRDVTPVPHNGCRPPKRRRV